MKRATLILFWAHLLTFSRGTWAQAPQQRTPQAPEQRTPEQRTPEQRTPEQRTPEQQAPHEEELPWYLLWGVEGPGNDNPRGTTSLGMPLNAPLSPTAQHVSWGLGVSAGAGYNFNRRHALVGDFMWNWLYPAEQGLRPIQVALNTNLVKAHGNLFAFTGGYKLELRGRSLGTYFIVGGGWYYRTASLSKTLPPGTPIPCSPALLWWGYDCSTGAVVGNLTEIHSNSSALGVNGGAGLTFRVGAAPYRVFVESRYHFAPTKNVTTQLVTVTWGIRY